MKYLPLCLFLIGCSPIPKSEFHEPKFMKGQKVTYKVPKFYSLVCSGKAEIAALENQAHLEPYTYILETGPEEHGCPYHLYNVYEENIEAAK